MSLTQYIAHTFRSSPIFNFLFSSPLKQVRANSSPVNYNDSYSSPVSYILGKREREEQASYILGKRKREEEIDSLNMWKWEWDEPYLQLLDEVCARQFSKMNHFNIELWQRFSEILVQRLNIDKDLIDGNDCMRRGKEFKKECERYQKEPFGPNPRKTILNRIFRRLVPRFPKGDACRRDNTVQGMLDRMSNRSSTGGGSSSRRSSSSRHSNSSRRSIPSSSPLPQWQIDLIEVLGDLITSHHLRFELLGKICDKFDEKMAVGFRRWSPEVQMQQLSRLMAPCNIISEEDLAPLALIDQTTQQFPLSPSADCPQPQTTQPFPFSPSADCTQLLEFSANCTQPRGAVGTRPLSPDEPGLSLIN